MAALIEEGAIEPIPTEVLGSFDPPEEVVAEVEAERQQEQAVQEEQEDALPEKYRGKSAKEIAQMHMEAERLIGRQGSEVGELRRLVDDYIRTQTAMKQQPQAEPVEEEEFFANPNRAVEKAVDSHPAIQQARQLSQEMIKTKALTALQAAHPDYQQLITDPGFLSWIDASRVRKELLARADKNYDFEAANELFTLYKERMGTAAKTVQAEKQTRKNAIKAATTTVSSGSDETPSKKIYRRADIMDLMQNNPDKYDMLQDEIMAAYREGRVR